MKFQQYLNEREFNILGFIYLTNEINEVSDEFLASLQKLGQKMGIKVRKSKTFQEQLGKAGKGVLHLMKLILDYSVHADILDKEPLLQLEKDIKLQFSKVQKEDIISFIVNIDKTFLGITSIPRHIMQNILGISISTYDNFQSNHDYVYKNMTKIIATLHAMGDTDNEELAKNF